MKSLLRKLLGAAPTPPRMLAPGTPAPDFRVAAHDGSTVSLGDLRGRKVVLWFYPKADTPGCTIEGKGLCAGYADFERLGATVLGVSFDTPAENRAFAEKFGFPYLLLCDTGRELGMAYGACDSRDAKHAKRISYLIDENGIIVHAMPQVDPATHAGEMLARLR
jgi:peroxiredoxin Q/BCP